MITINGNVLGPNDAKPDANSIIQFRLSGSMSVGANVIAPPVVTAALNTNDGSFSVQVEPTTTGLPATRFYDVSVIGSFGGVPANYRLGRTRVRSTPSTQNLNTLMIGEEPDRLHVSREEPFGLIDGVNPVFMSARVPQEDSELFFINEFLQRRVNAYQVTNNQFTCTNPPPIGSRLRLFYLNSAFDAPGHICRETPDGIVDGANTVFTLRKTPATGLEMGFVNEVFQVPGVSYTIVGNTITFAVAPLDGSRILFWYPSVSLAPAHRRDIFTGDGATTDFALAGAIFRNSELVFNGGLYQERNVQLHYTVSADQKTLKFAVPVPNGQKVVAHYQEGD